jgi:hypothetical protein
VVGLPGVVLLSRWIAVALAATPLPIVAVGEAPSGFEEQRLTMALATYLLDVRPQILPASAAGDAPSACEAGRAAAFAQAAPFATWCLWRAAGSEGAPSRLEVAVLPMEAGCAEAVSFVVELDPEQPAPFYRGVALKLSSVLRSFRALRLGAGVPPGLPQQPPALSPLDGTDGPSSPPRTWSADLRASAAVPLGSRQAEVLFGAGLWRDLSGFWLGLRGSASLPVRQRTAEARGEAFLATLHLALRRDLLEIGSGGQRFGVGAEVGLGAQLLWGSATRQGESTSHQGSVLSPQATAAVCARLLLFDRASLFAGPVADFSFVDGGLAMGSSTLYRTGWFRLRGDVGVELVF